MSEPVRSVATDKVARATTWVFVLGAAVWFAVALGFTVRGRALVSGFAVLAGLLMALQGFSWSRAVTARVSIDATTIARDGPGPARWSVARADVASARVVRLGATAYLVVTPASRPTTGWASRVLLGPQVPRGALAAPLDPDAVPDVERALADLDG